MRCQPDRRLRIAGRGFVNCDPAGSTACGSVGTQPTVRRTPFEENGSMSMYIGEALVGEGNEIAHIDLLIGDKSGPVGVAFANALANQAPGTPTCWPSSPPT